MRKLLKVPLGLLVAALVASGCAHTTPTPPAKPAVTAPPTPTVATPPNGFPDPASACTAQGGKYLGDMKCQHADGSIGTILYGAAAQRAMLSSTHEAANTPHAWALATTAIIFEFNRNRLDMLAGTAITPDGEANGKRLLSDGWGVNNRDDLLHTLTWLQFQGHRTEFEELGRRVDDLTEQQLLIVEAAAQNNPSVLNQLEIAIEHHRALGTKGILAWDLVRYITLCRWGYLAGYLSDTEAWERIMPAALRLQQSFTSWQDLQNDFLIGREYWLVLQTENRGARFRAIYERFLQDPSSPWNANPWTMDLKVAAPLPIELN